MSDDTEAIGTRAERIAVILWPALVLVPSGSWDDRHGIDAYWGASREQIKGDRSMAPRQRLFHELYEKTKGQPDHAWRRSPGFADVYIFVTDGGAVRIATSLLAELECDRRLIAISPTAIGFEVPLAQVPRQDPRVEFKAHSLWSVPLNTLLREHGPAVLPAPVPSGTGSPGCYFCGWAGARRDREMNWSVVAQAWLCGPCFHRRWDGVTVLGA